MARSSLVLPIFRFILMFWMLVTILYLRHFEALLIQRPCCDVHSPLRLEVVRICGHALGEMLRISRLLHEATLSTDLASSERIKHCFGLIDYITLHA